MSELRSGPTTDRDLLALGRSLLQEHGYSTEDLEEGELTITVGENPYFIVVVVASPTFDQLLEAEDIAERVLLERLAERDLGAKAYDIYLILLTQEKLPAERSATREFFAITYDTKLVRRIVHTGVEPSMTFVREALVPFVPPRQLDDPRMTTDPMSSLSDALISRGLEKNLVMKAIRAFREGVDIGDAF